MDLQFDLRSFVDSSRRRLLRRHLVESDGQIDVVLARLVCFIPSKSNQQLTSAELEHGFDPPKSHIPIRDGRNVAQVSSCLEAAFHKRTSRDLGGVLALARFCPQPTLNLIHAIHGQLELDGFDYAIEKGRNNLL